MPDSLALPEEGLSKPESPDDKAGAAAVAAAAAFRGPLDGCVVMRPVLQSQGGFSLWSSARAGYASICCGC